MPPYGRSFGTEKIIFSIYTINTRNQGKHMALFMFSDVKCDCLRVYGEAYFC